MVTCYHNSAMRDFDAILAASRRIADEFPSTVFIDGVALYLHEVNTPTWAKEAVEARRDVVFMLSLADFSELRHTDELVSNRRRGNHQLIRNGIEFDVYVERQNNLAVPYDETVAHAITYEGMQIACLEHLLILKLNAFIDRAQGSKGDRDARDLVTISQVAGGRIRPSLISPYLREEHLAAMELMASSPVFMRVSRGNACRAQALRTTFSELAVKVAAAHGRAAKKSRTGSLRAL